MGGVFKFVKYTKTLLMRNRHACFSHAFFNEISEVAHIGSAPRSTLHACRARFTQPPRFAWRLYLKALCKAAHAEHSMSRHA